MDKIKVKVVDNDVKPCVLAISGSDSGGNAGVQADLRMISSVYRLHCCTAITALTAQNPFGVKSVLAADAAFVKDQIQQVLEVYNIVSVKTGMLGSRSVAEAVAEELARCKAVRKVVDPVMVATSGARLLDSDAIDIFKNALLPLADVATPNIPEAQTLLGRTIPDSDAALAEAAEELSKATGTAILLKGGHSKNAPSCDYFFDRRRIIRYNLPRIENPVSTHGTGCSLASAVAAEFALGKDAAQAVECAKKTVYRAILAGYRVGADCGVLGMPERT